MKICVLAPEFIPVWGGTGTYTQELVTHLPDTYEIHLVTPRRESFGAQEAPTDYAHETLGSNIHIHYVSKANDTFLYNAKFQYACLRYVPKLLKKEKIDIIQSHMSH